MRVEAGKELFEEAQFFLIIFGDFCTFLVEQKNNDVTVSSRIGILPDWLRARLHGEFQLGLKFQVGKGGKILLRLHDKFQPGLPDAKFEIAGEESSENQERFLYLATHLNIS